MRVGAELWKTFANGRFGAEVASVFCAAFRASVGGPCFTDYQTKVSIMSTEEILFDVEDRMDKAV
ncbi:MAG: hypothetical protein IJ991_06920, partial [Thermoguttaceae bacterium]|nr:hypothetical protein [Thermoguttaceae bacterium]